PACRARYRRGQQLDEWTCIGRFPQWPRLRRGRVTFFKNPLTSLRENNNDMPVYGSLSFNQVYFNRAVRTTAHCPCSQYSAYYRRAGLEQCAVESLVMEKRTPQAGVPVAASAHSAEATLPAHRN